MKSRGKEGIDPKLAAIYICGVRLAIKDVSVAHDMLELKMT